ncbi:MAG TPA: hypothetical protein VFV99_00245, partial [Kofleriaceae bacterium]|nr:hypothetical protein [Kofleriaceae bacterium]
MLSLELGRRLQVPVVHLDQLRFRSGWQSVETAELLGHEQRALPRDGRWIADGNNGATMETRLAAADTIIFLDLA